VSGVNSADCSTVVELEKEVFFMANNQKICSVLYRVVAEESIRSRTFDILTFKEQISELEKAKKVIP